MGHFSNSKQIENEKCPLVKIKTDKSFQKSLNCEDLYNINNTKNTELDHNLKLNNSIDNYIDDNESDYYYELNSKNKISLESVENIGDNYGDLNKNTPNNQKSQDFISNQNFIRNSELSFDQIKKVQFDYITENKLVNDSSEFKLYDGKENEIDGN